MQHKINYFLTNLHTFVYECLRILNSVYCSYMICSEFYAFILVSASNSYSNFAPFCFIELNSEVLKFLYSIPVWLTALVCVWFLRGKRMAVKR